MGGSGAGGNVTAAAEFNVHHDPEAVAAVLGCGAAAADVRPGRVRAGPPAPSDVERLLASEHPALALAGRLAAASAARSGTDDACLGDAGAVVALLRPDLLRAAPRPVAVQLGEGPARGATVVDRREGGRDVARDGVEVLVFEEADGPALAQCWLQTLLAAFGGPR